MRRAAIGIWLTVGSTGRFRTVCVAHGYNPYLLSYGFIGIVATPLINGSVRWQVSTCLYTELVLDSLDMAVWTGEGIDLAGLTHHSDRGVQDRSIRYIERFEAEDAVGSVGSKGDSYDNAMTQALSSLFKAELVRSKGSCQNVNHLEVAAAQRVDWYTHPSVFRVSSATSRQ